jgi:hypothetical protein
MNVEIGTEVAQFPEKEYINGIFLAVWIWVDGKWCWVVGDAEGGVVAGWGGGGVEGWV